MTQKQFIEEVAKYVQKYAPQYGIKVYSPIIAQFCLESGYGTTNKVKKVLEDGVVDWRHNYAGLKWRNKRCAISNDYFEEWTSEQNADKSYSNIISKFYRFKSLEDCVIGYFQFTNISAYKNLKGVTDPQTYLENIKADNYATSIDYVQNNMNVIKKWNLTQYDPVSKKYWRVQTGAYILKSGAEKLVKELKDAGFEAIVKKVGLYWKVQVGAFNNKSGAEALMARVVAKGFKAFITYS